MLNELDLLPSLGSASPMILQTAIEKAAMNEPISRADFNRLEAKVDALAQDTRILILIEERQAEQGKRIGQLEQRMYADEVVTSKIDKTLNQWINRGIGAWALAALIYAATNVPWISSLVSRK